MWIYPSPLIPICTYIQWVCFLWFVFYGGMFWGICEGRWCYCQVSMYKRWAWAIFVSTCLVVLRWIVLYMLFLLTFDIWFQSYVTSGHKDLRFFCSDAFWILCCISVFSFGFSNVLFNLLACHFFFNSKFLIECLCDCVKGYSNLFLTLLFYVLYQTLAHFANYWRAYEAKANHNAEHEALVERRTSLKALIT